MSSVLLCFTALCISVLASSAFAGQMDGEWVSVSRVRAGEEQRGAPMRAVIKDGKFSTVRDGKAVEQGKISETADVSPSSYDIEMAGNVDDAGKTFHGIYSVSGNTMLTCVNPDPSGSRPTVFKSTKEDGMVFMVWQRDEKGSLKESELDRVFDFLNENAANRTLVGENEGTLAEGRVGYRFRREATLCNLTHSGRRLCYDVIYIIRQSKWDIVEGEHKPFLRVEDRMLVERHELGLKASTGEVVGHSETITSTRSNWGGGTDTLRMKVIDGELVVERSTVPYEDFFDRGNTFFPGASDIREIWQIEDGKLVVKSRRKVYQVNPENLDRRLIDDQSEPTIETETARLPLE